MSEFIRTVRKFENKSGNPIRLLINFNIRATHVVFLTTPKIVSKLFSFNVFDCEFEIINFWLWCHCGYWIWIWDWCYSNWKYPRIPASSGSQQTNKPLGSSSDENINSQNPNSDSSQKKKKHTKDRRDPQVDMEEAQRAAEEKAEQLRIQAEKALKQQEEEEYNRRYRDEIFQPWGGVSFNTQFTPQGDPPLDLSYDDLFHSPHFSYLQGFLCHY